MMIKTWLTIVAACVVLMGCNTVHGFGQDMQKVGEKIEDAAKKK
jgi:predicted small secreted protein